jgi:hypothetical protein
MSTNATTTLTVWSADRAALDAFRARVAGPSTPFSLEAAVPTGLALDAWDHDRATALWGCGRPELPGAALADLGDRLVFQVDTPWAPPHTAFATLSAEFPGTVAHALTTCETEYASTAWFVAGRTVDMRETELDLPLEELDDWDGEWDLPADWAFDMNRARTLAD